MYSAIRLLKTPHFYLVLLVFSAFPSHGRDGEDRLQRVMVVDGSVIHDGGNMRLHTGNWGGFGSWPGSTFPFADAPSGEWPLGSGIEYIFTGGLWVGAIKSGVPAVSTAGYQLEFRPTPEAIDSVYYSAQGDPGGNRIPSPDANDDGDGVENEEWHDGRDNDSDGSIDEDFAAISDQMLSCWYTDDQDTAIVLFPNHSPHGITVRQESYQWAHNDYDDFVGFRYEITNHGSNVLEDVYVGIFFDGDAGHRDSLSYWEDDAIDHIQVPVMHGPRGTKTYDFYYVYDEDGDGGKTTGYFGILILDHPTDPTGVEAPQQVGAASIQNFDPTAGSFALGGHPGNDAQRYQAMSAGAIDPMGTGDVSGVIAVGPFKEIRPGETIEFAMALVATPRGDFTNVIAAAQTYHGGWFDLDGNPATGIDGEEHQEHWYPPTLPPVPVFITNFDARADGTHIRLSWAVAGDEPVAGYRLYRAEGGGQLLPHADGELSASAREFIDQAVRPGTRYEYVLEVYAESGWTARSQTARAMVARSVLELHQNYPNPFNPETVISFTLRERARVVLSIYAPNGRRVAALLDERIDAGVREVTWDGKDRNGRSVGSGVYFYQLTVGNETFSRKMVLLK